MSPCSSSSRPGGAGPARRPLKFAVLQLGARMHYAVPALFKRAGMLQHFYTDAVGNLGLTGTLGRLLPPRLCPAPLRRLLARRIPAEVSPGEITTAQTLTVLDGLRHSVEGRPDLTEDIAPAWLRHRMTIEKFRGANALYCLDPGDADVVHAAKERGMLVVYEQIIAPHVGWILREERSRFPDLEVQDSEELVKAGIRLEQQIWNMADLILAPSQFVRDGLIELGAPTEKIGLVPYGVPEAWLEPIAADPIPGRVLFVGGVGLRKGNHYLAEACRILAARGVAAEFRVVGGYDAQEIASPLFQGPTYVGQVPRSQVREEFLRADVFAFPTLVEGFALSHLEAMACGLPVVTTPGCGPAVREGQDGFVVPPRDAHALADKIQAIITDRALRRRMSESARERAASYSWGHYRQRLLEAVTAADARRAA